MSYFKNDKLEYEFLPQALEIQETPPSPIGRFIIWAIFAIIVIAIVWSCIGVIDEVASARGKLIPDGRIKVIQSVDTGIVKSVFIKEGQRVKKGEHLIELDSSLSKTDYSALENSLLVEKLEKDLIYAQIHSQDINSILSKSKVPFDLLNTERQYIENRINEYESKRKSYQSIIDQRTKEMEMIQLDIKDLNKKLQESKEDFDEHSKLYEDSGICLDELNTKEDLYLNAQNNLDTQKLRLLTSKESLKQAVDNLNSFEKEWITQSMNLILEKEKKVSQIKVELTKEKEKMSYQLIVSPVNGVIQGLSVTTIGSIVKAADPIMTIVPDNIELVIEANVTNSDIGFVKSGQTVEVKFDTFPFQRYGTVKGTVVSVSPDAFEDEKLGTIYKIKVKIHSSKIMTETGYVNLSAGMTGTVEVKTGKRKIIEFFLDPFEKSIKESVNIR